MIRRRPVRALLLAGALLAGACQEKAMSEAVSIDAATAFLGRPLPPGARDARAAGEEGLDRLVLIRFDAPPDQIADFARLIAGCAPVIGRDPGLGYLGKGLDWWAAAPPPDFAGCEGTHGNRTIKLLTAPAADGRRTAWIAAFTL